MSIRALMFGWEYPPRHLGGLGVACQGLVRGLARNGVHVTLVLPHAAQEDHHNVDIRFPTKADYERIGVCSLLSPYDSATTYADRVRHLPDEVRDIYGHDLGSAIEHYTAASVELTKQANPDVIHCHDWMTYEAGIRSKKYHGKPLVAHIHATELDRTHFNPNQWIYERERYGFGMADKIVAVSNYTKRLLTEHYGISPDKIVAIHNGNSEEHAHIPHLVSKHGRHASPLVLFLGRLTIQKGAWQFLDMATQVHAVRPEVQFIIAGDGDMLPSLIERTCDLGLSDCMVFAGKVNNNEATKLYRHASCFVMPSVSEPFGLVALEAIAHGTPVILSKQSGAAEVVDHAFKVDFWDTEKMADCVLTVLREEPLAMQLRSEAPRILQHLTWQNQAQRVRAIYEQLLPTISHG